MKSVVAEKETLAANSPKRKRRSALHLSYTSRDTLWGYLMIAPLMFGVLTFYIWPVAQNLYFSFTSWGLFGTYHWTGLTNYQNLVQDAEVGKALLNSLLFTVISVPCSIALSIIVAVLLNQKLRGVLVYRTIFFLPVVTMPAAIAVVWRWLYNGDYGLINYVLKLFSITGPRWVADPRTALLSLILVAIWASIGQNMILFLAGLQGISRTYYEAAAVDGSGRFRTFFGITLPLLSPTIFFTAVIGMINALQVFDLIFLMFDRNSPPMYAAETVVYLFYDHAMNIGDKGYAAAIAVILEVIILVVTAVQFRVQRKWVYYA